MYELGSHRSTIREIFEYGNQRAAIVGRENVLDFSLGNPNVPAPDEVRQAILAEAAGDPVAIHGYTSAPGAPDVRRTLADSLNRRFGTDYTGDSLYLTAGAAAALSCAPSRALVVRGGRDSSCSRRIFPEYKMFIESGAGAKCVHRAAVHRGFPDRLRRLCEQRVQRAHQGGRCQLAEQPVRCSVLRADHQAPCRHAARQGEGIRSPDLPDFGRAVPRDRIRWRDRCRSCRTIYDDTIVCYSYSKSLSLPGERIGYVLVPPAGRRQHRRCTLRSAVPAAHSVMFVRRVCSSA